MVAEIKESRRVVSVDLGPRTLRLVDHDAHRALRWRGEKRQHLGRGDLLPVRIVRDEKKGDTLVLAQPPDVQAALVAIDNKTGDVRALVGGYDFAQSQFNRATQARRQAGSSIKPFIYATALAQKDFNHLSVVADSPIAIKTASGIWAPQNYKHEYLGPVTLRTALAKSINTVSVRLTAAIGVDPIIKTMRSLGITTPIPRHISVALGTPDVTPLEMTSAFAAFPAGGKRIRPRFCQFVTTDDGRVVEDSRGKLPEERALPGAVAYLMVDLMKTVVARGTARKAATIERPVGAKTGTSTGFRDAWFIGYTPELTVGVWVGRDNFKPIGYGATGGTTALPIWLDFMRAAHPATPVVDFPAPSDVTFVRADEMTGMPAPAGTHNAAWVPFARGTVPGRFLTGDTHRFSTASQ
ncbi:MAG: penicillin-binding transpeptidase domain-containing protein, partial [Pseudomonadota bacterium]